MSVGSKNLTDHSLSILPPKSVFFSQQNLLQQEEKNFSNADFAASYAPRIKLANVFGIVFYVRKERVMLRSNHSNKFC
jgi:hypothetical protein